MTTRQEGARDLRLVLALVFVKLIVSCIILRLGFSHVSDDDYARVVIAQTFAHKPSVDPSGTSWLPFPFWIAGGVFMIAGRSLAVANVLALVQGGLGWGALFLALRRGHLTAWAAWVAAAIGMCLPWNAWLGASIVPEGYVGPLLAAAMILGAKPNAFAAIALLVCSLSRYESWPIAAVIAAHWLVQAARVRNAKWALLSLTSVAGAFAWMAWNHHAHGDALHFFVRVSRYRQNLNLPASAWVERLLLYPLAVLHIMGPVACIATGAAAALVNRQTRALWRVPLGLAAVFLVALIAGELKDGAPTHHPERAVLAIVSVLLAAGVSGWVTLFTIAKRRSAREMLFIGGSAALATCSLAWVVETSRDYPGRSASESRKAQIARGAALSSEVRYQVTPCAYEHFALIAAFGRPEQIEIREPSVRHEPTEQCPYVKMIDGRE